MERQAINFLGRLMNWSKIKEFESRIKDIYKSDWKNRPWEEYAIDCFKLQSENKELIINSSGTQRMEYLVGLQALYNVRKKELDFIENKVLQMPINEYKFLFSSEYEIILSDIGKEDLNTAIQLYGECGLIANSMEIKNKLMWKYVSACLTISAINEVFGDQLNKIENNIRNL